MTVGIEVSQAGHGVGTATDDLLIVNDQFSILKVFKEGDGTLTLPGADASSIGTITHNLGYKSVVLVYSQVSAGGTVRAQVVGRPPFIPSSAEVSMELEIKANTFEITTRGGPLGSDKDFIFHYYVTNEDIIP